MGGVDTPGDGAVDLAEYFLAHLRCIGVSLEAGAVRMEPASRRPQGIQGFLPGDRALFVVWPLAGERQVDTPIYIRMFLAKTGGMLRPGTRHHQGRRRYRPFQQQLLSRRIEGLAHPVVIGIDDQQPVARPVTNPFVLCCHHRRSRLQGRNWRLWTGPYARCSTGLCRGNQVYLGTRALAVPDTLPERLTAQVVGYRQERNRRKSRPESCDLLRHL